MNLIVAFTVFFWIQDLFIFGDKGGWDTLLYPNQVQMPIGIDEATYGYIFKFL